MASADDDSTKGVEDSNPVCDGCKDDGIGMKNAHSFCYNCRLYLCSTCDKSHRRFQPDHRVAYDKDMPHERIMEVFAPCELHTKESVEYYCSKHGSVFCRYCKRLKHSNCFTESISSVIYDKQFDQNCSETLLKVCKLKKDMERTEEETQSENNEILGKIETLNSNSQDLKRKINAFFDRYEAHLDLYRKSITENMTAHIQSYHGFANELEKQRNSVATLKEESKRFELLLCMLKSEQIYNEYKTLVEEIKNKKIKPAPFMFHDDMLPTLLWQISKLQCTENKDGYSDEADGGMSKSFWNIKTCTLKNEVILNADRMSTAVSRCCLLQNGQAVVCFSSIRLLRVFNKDMKARYDVHLDGIPFDVAVFNRNGVIVTIPDAKTIHFITVIPGLKLEHDIKLDQNCYGIRSYGEEIFTCVSDEKQRVNALQILSEKGTLIKNIPFPESVFARYICLSADGSKIFYSEHSAKCVDIVCVTRDGQGLFRFSLANATDILGLLSDAADNLIVCYKYNTYLFLQKCSLCIIKSGGVDSRTLLEDDMSKYSTTSVCLNQSENELLIASYTFNRWTKNFISKHRSYKLDYVIQ